MRSCSCCRTTRLRPARPSSGSRRAFYFWVAPRTDCVRRRYLPTLSFSVGSPRASSLVSAALYRSRKSARQGGARCGLCTKVDCMDGIASAQFLCMGRRPLTCNRRAFDQIASHHSASERELTLQHYIRSSTSERSVTSIRALRTNVASRTRIPCTYVKVE